MGIQVSGPEGRDKAVAVTFGVGTTVEDTKEAGGLHERETVDV